MCLSLTLNLLYIFRMFEIWTQNIFVDINYYELNLNFFCFLFSLRNLKQKLKLFGGIDFPSNYMTSRANKLFYFYLHQCDQGSFIKNVTL
jgi:hypothetical protein